VFVWGGTSVVCGLSSLRGGGAGVSFEGVFFCWGCPPPFFGGFFVGDGGGGGFCGAHFLGADKYMGGGGWGIKAVSVGFFLDVCGVLVPWADGGRG